MGRPAPGTPVVEHSMRIVDPHVAKTVRGPVNERAAATEHVRAMEYYADDWNEGPSWRGHALPRAFLAGIDWERARREGEGE